ncbi:GFA family protein [Sphingomonas sp. PR090111-T3T-6A]|uniref:GFA family protein n=1 Tax=Sphingomonas sp. PR090111-T3T-6A TaxID=685778 RepID=UPI00036E69F8|nr:GFA family protein [Sphingomonas sp. PR090111-T3T-6A]
MPDIMTGGCQCGRVRYAVPIASDEAYLCHCNYCKRATGGVSIAFKNVRFADVTWTKSPPDWYQSSPIARRPFCSACGTPLGFQFLDGENMDLTVGSFDDPSRFRPTSNFSIETALTAWMDASQLPGKRLDEHAPAVDRWIKDIGKLPD